MRWTNAGTKIMIQVIQMVPYAQSVVNILLIAMP